MDTVRSANRKHAGVGFTLVELLVIISIISVLFAVTLVAIDPATRFKAARDARRYEEARSVMEAIVTYVADNSGTIPSGIDSVTGSVQILGTNSTGCAATACTGYGTNNTIANSCLDLSSALVDTYLGAIPLDPLYGTNGNTRYFVNKTSSGRIEVGSCDPERVTTISVKR
jgi:type II secretory pathway pseudopilin PulG